MTPGLFNNRIRSWFAIAHTNLSLFVRSFINVFLDFLLVNKGLLLLAYRINQVYMRTSCEIFHTNYPFPGFTLI